METAYSYLKIPRLGIATFDTFSIGLEKHRVIALPESDVSESRKKLRELRRTGINISFNNWLKKVIGNVITVLF
jgi:hypothetical protein